MPGFSKTSLGNPNGQTYETRHGQYGDATDSGHYVNMLIDLRGKEVFGGFSPPALAAFRKLARRKHNNLNPLYQTWTARNFTAYHAQRISLMVNYYAADEIALRFRPTPGPTSPGDQPQA